MTVDMFFAIFCQFILFGAGFMFVVLFIDGVINLGAWIIKKVGGNNNEDNSSF